MGGEISSREGDSWLERTHRPGKLEAFPRATFLKSQGNHCLSVSRSFVKTRRSCLKAGVEEKRN